MAISGVLCSIIVIQRRSDFVVFIPAQTNDLLSKQERIESSGKTISTKEESLERTDTGLLEYEPMNPKCELSLREQVFSCCQAAGNTWHRTSIM
jgi:hypothetical protein